MKSLLQQDIGWYD